MLCSWGDRAPPPGLTVSLIITPFIWQVMVTNVTSLLKTVKAVEDEATRGTRALEATIECIRQELTVRWPHRPEPLLFTFFHESTDETQPLCRAGSNTVRDICVCYSEQNSGAFVLFFLYYLSSSSSSSFPLGPCRFLTALIRVWVAGAGRVRRKISRACFFFCNLLLILIGGSPAWEEALARAAAKVQFYTVYLTSNFIATHIKHAVILTCLHFMLLYRIHVDIFISSLTMCRKYAGLEKPKKLL